MPTAHEEDLKAIRRKSSSPLAELVALSPEQRRSIGSQKR
jgi:hypothetical protein